MTDGFIYWVFGIGAILLFLLAGRFLLSLRTKILTKSDVEQVSQVQLSS